VTFVRTLMLFLRMTAKQSGCARTPHCRLEKKILAQARLIRYCPSLLSVPADIDRMENKGG
jgi:hypothetical protein